jgi:hypothetical protein
MFARRIALSLAAVGLAGLIFSGSGLVHAQTPSETSARGLVGQIRDLNEDSFLLTQNGTGETFTVFLNGFDASAALTTHGSGGRAQFQNNAQVAVLVDDGMTAVQILVKPSRPTVLPFSGAVTSVENGTLTVVRPSGESMTVQISSRKSAPQAGAVVMGFARASDSRGAPPVSIGLTTAEEMRSRLEGFIDEANSAASHRPEQPGTNPQERSARLAEILANHTAHQVAILQSVLDRDNLSNKARAAVTRAHSSAKVGLQRAREVAVLARAAVRDMGVRGEPEDTHGRGSAQLSDGS